MFKKQLEELNHNECKIQSSRLRLQIDKLEADKETLASEIDALKSTIHDLTSTNRNLSDEIDRLKCPVLQTGNEPSRENPSIVNEIRDRSNQCVDKSIQVKPDTCDQQTQLEPSEDETIPDKDSLNEVMQELETLRKQVEFLTIDLSERDKIIRLKQQNLNDLKKAFRKEMIDNRRSTAPTTATQAAVVNMDLNSYETTSSLNHVSQRLESRLLASRHEANANNVLGGISRNGTSNACYSRHSPTVSHGSGSQAGTGSPQFDTALFNRSRSSASMAEFDNASQADLTSREVNQEYLRNVLFRYMSNRNCDSDQHLVKAISKLMNFSPEQCAAIKSAMHWRSSWLRPLMGSARLESSNHIH